VIHHPSSGDRTLRGHTGQHPQDNAAAIFREGADQNSGGYIHLVNRISQLFFLFEVHLERRRTGYVELYFVVCGIKFMI
jgi:hypothetical protein